MWEICIEQKYRQIWNKMTATLLMESLQSLTSANLSIDKKTNSDNIVSFLNGPQNGLLTVPVLSHIVIGLNVAIRLMR